MSNYRLENLEYFGFREIGMAADLMNAYADGKAPRWFDDSGVAVEFNPCSGCVFLTNDECQVLVFDGTDLVGWHFLGYAGNEGTVEDLWYEYEHGDIDRRDYEELADILEMEGEDEKADMIREAMDAADDVAME